MLVRARAGAEVRCDGSSPNQTWVHLFPAVAAGGVGAGQEVVFTPQGPNGTRPPTSRAAAPRDRLRLLGRAWLPAPAHGKETMKDKQFPLQDVTLILLRQSRTAEHNLVYN